MSTITAEAVIALPSSLEKLVLQSPHWEKSLVRELCISLFLAMGTIGVLEDSLFSFYLRHGGEDDPNVKRSAEIKKFCKLLEVARWKADQIRNEMKTEGLDVLAFRLVIQEELPALSGHAIRSKQCRNAKRSLRLGAM